MKSATTGSIAVASAFALAMAVGCTKGSTLGGTELEPAAVETAGVPTFEAHGTGEEHEEDATGGEHDNVATPAEQHSTEVTADHSTETVGASSAGDLPPDGGNVVTTTEGSVTTTNP